MDDQAINIRLLTITSELRDIAIELGVVKPTRRSHQDNIVAAVCGFYSVTESQLTRRARTKAVSEPRRVAMALLREMTEMTLGEIGDRFGGRDHTTIIYACNTVRDEAASNPSFAQDVDAIRNIIATRTPQ